MYKFLKHTADVMFEVETTSLNKLFEDAGKAVMATMAELKTVKPKVKKELKLKANKIEDLLYDFLAELVYLKDSEFMMFSGFNVKVDEKKVSLSAQIMGDKIDSVKQKLGVDVKAVTMHMFSVEKKLLGKASAKTRRYKWFARVLLDV